MLASLKFKYRDWSSSEVTWQFLHLPNCLCQEQHASEGTFSRFGDRLHIQHWSEASPVCHSPFAFDCLEGFQSTEELTDSSQAFYSITIAFLSHEVSKPQAVSMSAISRHLIMKFWKFDQSCLRWLKLLHRKIATSVKGVSQIHEDFVKAECRRWRWNWAAFFENLEIVVDTEFRCVGADTSWRKSSCLWDCNACEFNSRSVQKTKGILDRKNWLKDFFAFSLLDISVGFGSASFKWIFLDQQISRRDQFFSTLKHSFSLWTGEKASCEVIDIVCSRHIGFHDSVRLQKICFNIAVENICIAFKTCFSSDASGGGISHIEKLWNEQCTQIADSVFDCRLLSKFMIYRRKENDSFDFSLHAEDRCDDQALCSHVACDCLACFWKHVLIFDEDNSILRGDHLFIFAENIIGKFLTSCRRVRELLKTGSGKFRNQRIKDEVNLSVSHSVVIDPDGTPVDSEFLEFLIVIVQIILNTLDHSFRIFVLLFIKITIDLSCFLDELCSEELAIKIFVSEKKHDRYENSREAEIDKLFQYRLKFHFCTIKELRFYSDERRFRRASFFASGWKSIPDFWPFFTSAAISWSLFIREIGVSSTSGSETLPASGSGVFAGSVTVVSGSSVTFVSGASGVSVPVAVFSSPVGQLFSIVEASGVGMRSEGVDAGSTESADGSEGADDCVFFS